MNITLPDAGIILQSINMATTVREKIRKIEKSYTKTSQSKQVLIRESKYVRQSVIQYIEQLEQENERLKQELLERDKVRLMTKIECRELTDAILEIRSESGKETKYFHYTNEFDMINKIVLGMTAKKYRALYNIDDETLIRDCVTKSELDAIQTLQKLNAALFTVGMSFDNRKVLLQDRYTKTKYKLLK